MTIWIKDPKDGTPSVTLTAFCTGFIVCTIKLAFSGLSFKGLALSPFTGTDFAAAVGALGAIYWARRNAGNTN